MISLLGIVPILALILLAAAIGLGIWADREKAKQKTNPYEFNQKTYDILVGVSTGCAVLALLTILYFPSGGDDKLTGGNCGFWFWSNESGVHCATTYRTVSTYFALVIIFALAMSYIVPLAMNKAKFDGAPKYVPKETESTFSNYNGLNDNMLYTNAAGGGATLIMLIFMLWVATPGNPRKFHYATSIGTDAQACARFDDELSTKKIGDSTDTVGECYVIKDKRNWKNKRVAKKNKTISEGRYATSWGNCDVCSDITTCNVFARCVTISVFCILAGCYLLAMGSIVQSDFDKERSDPYWNELSIASIVFGITTILFGVLMGVTAVKCPSGSEFRYASNDILSRELKPDRIFNVASPAEGMTIRW